MRVISDASWCASVSFEQASDLKGSVYLVSGSSKQSEFADLFKKGWVEKSQSLVNADVEKKSGVVIVNEGKPINLRYGSLNDEVSDFMYANISAAIIEGGAKRDSRIHRLSGGWQKRVCRKWSKHYLNG
jgi:hypothetical protein